MAEESIAKLRRPHARTIRPHQWHITRGGPTIKKKLRRGASPNMTEGLVAAPHLMHPTKPYGCIYVENTSEQYCLGRRNLGMYLMGQVLKWCTG